MQNDRWSWRDRVIVAIVFLVLTIVSLWSGWSFYQNNLADNQMRADNYRSIGWQHVIGVVTKVEEIYGTNKPEHSVVEVNYTYPGNELLTTTKLTVGLGYKEGNTVKFVANRAGDTKIISENSFGTMYDPTIYNQDNEWIGALVGAAIASIIIFFIGLIIVCIAAGLFEFISETIADWRKDNSKLQKATS